MATQKNEFNSYLSQLEDMLELYLVKKAPSIPSKWKELIVKLAPWLTLILMLFALPVVLGALGVGALLAPIGILGGFRIGILNILTLLLTAVSLVMEAMAIPGLFNKTKKGWYMVYYSTLLYGVVNILDFNIGGLILGTLLSLYFLFQVKEYYK